MSRPVATPQRLDPLGALAAGQAAALFSALSIAYAVYSTLQHGAQVTHPVQAVFALVLLACGCTVLVVASRPGRAPLGRGVFVSVMALTLLAYLLSTAATWGGNRLVQDDWGPYAVAFVLASVALTRPSIEILIVGLVAAVVAVALAVSQSAFLAIAVSPGVYAIVAATPIVAFTCASAGYSQVLVARIRRWQFSARTAMVHLEPEVREVTARVAHQQQVTLLNEGAVPLFAGILESGRLTENDIERARAIGAALRANVVAAVERSWLDEVMFRSQAATVQAASLTTTLAPATPSAAEWARFSSTELLRMPPEPPHGLDDPAGVAERIGDELRAVLTAFIMAVALHPSVEAGSLHLALRSAGPGWKLRCEARVAGSGPELRAAFNPYLAVFRVLTVDADLRCRRGAVALKFSYDRS